MKKLYILLAFAIMFTSVQAQNVSVTFRVTLKGTGKKLHPDSLRVTGALGAVEQGDWSPPAALKLKLNDQIKTWRDLKKVNRNPVLILEYRDQGNSKYHYFPNIIESKFTNADAVASVFIKCIFGRQFEWATYNFNKEVHKYLGLCT